MSIELVALDIAGTTVQEHNAVYDALADAVRAAGGSPSTSDIAAWMGADKREAITALLGGSPPASAVDATFDDFRVRLADAYAARPPTPLPGVPEALAKLRANGVKVALTTGFDRVVTDGLLATLGWDSGVIDAVVCVDDVAAGRPAPHMIHRAMELTGVRDVRRVAAVGDTVRDLRAGMNAGAAAVVGVLTGGQTETQLGAEPHTHLLSSVADLPMVLELT